MAVVVERFMDRKFLLPLSVLLLLISVHFYYLNRYAINIPFSDDYNEILQYLNLMLDSNSMTESGGHLLHGVGYSKPITLRLFATLHYMIFNEISFRYLIFTGNFFLLLTCFIFIISALDISKYLIVTTACFIFQPQYWEALYQSTLSVSVFSCLFFSMASIYCMTRKSTCYYAASLLFAVLAQISFGNGFLVYPILLLISVQNKDRRQFSITFVVMILFTYLYMLGNTVSYTAGQEMELVTRLKLWSVWLLEFLGSSVGYVFSSGYERNAIDQAVAIVTGSLLLCFYMFLIIKKYYANNQLLFSFMTFFILTAVLATKLRFTVEVPGASRYQIQSALTVLTALIIFFDLYAAIMNRYIIILLAVILPLLFVFGSYKTNLPSVSGHRVRLATGLWSWLNQGTGLTVWSDEEAAGRLLIQSNNRNIYRIPSKESLMAEAWK